MLVVGALPPYRLDIFRSSMGSAAVYGCFFVFFDGLRGLTSRTIRHFNNPAGTATATVAGRQDKRNASFPLFLVTQYCRREQSMPKRQSLSRCQLSTSTPKLCNGWRVGAHIHTVHTLGQFRYPPWLVGTACTRAFQRTRAAPYFNSSNGRTAGWSLKPARTSEPSKRTLFHDRKVRADPWLWPTCCMRSLCTCSGA